MTAKCPFREMAPIAFNGEHEAVGRNQKCLRCRRRQTLRSTDFQERSTRSRRVELCRVDSAWRLGETRCFEELVHRAPIDAPALVRDRHVVRAEE